MYLDFRDPLKTDVTAESSLRVNRAKRTPRLVGDKMRDKFKKKETILDQIHKVVQENKNKDNNNSKKIEFDDDKPIVDEPLTENTINTPPPPVNSGRENRNFQFKSFEFRGDAKEFFKIWIVNVALTILTLGIYSAWAKVRTNRYIYGNTYLNNSNFEYNADPKRILLGRLIIAAFYLTYVIFGEYLNIKIVAGIISLLFILLFPWLMRQAISFKLKNTTYRNIPFKFHGKVRSFYGLGLIYIAIFTIIPIAIAATAKYNKEIAGIAAIVAYFAIMFIFMPMIYRRYKALVINNSSYADGYFKFTASNRETIFMFIKLGLLLLIVMIILGFFAVFLSKIAIGAFNGIKMNFTGNAELIKIATAAGGMVIYLLFMGLFKGIVDGYLSNFIRNHLQFENAQFKGTIKSLKLGFISATNMLILVLTLGLAYPWTKFRYLKYKIENTHFACSNYDQFTSGKNEEVTAIGEEAMDFFDIDVGF